MRILTLFLLVIAGSLLLAAALSPHLHTLLGGLTTKGPGGLINLTAKLLSIPLFLLLLRHLGMLSWAALGYALPKPRFRRELLLGWLAGVLILTLLSLTLLLLEVRLWRPPGELLARRLLQIVTDGLLAGLLVGLIEETFFRGAVYGALRRAHGAVTAALLSSLLYAAMHFIEPTSSATVGEGGMFGGIPLLWDALDGITAPQNLGALIALFMVGLLLSVIRERTGNIAYVIGMHAGWVCVITTTRKFSYLSPDSELGWMVGSYDGITGHLATLWLGFLIAGYLLLWRRRAT